MEYFPLVSSAIDHVHVLLNGGESPKVTFHFVRTSSGLIYVLHRVKLFLQHFAFKL